MANDIHKIKLLVLWDILCKNTDEDHAMNTDEIIARLADRGIEVSRKTVVEDIKTLCAYGYEVLSYKKMFHYYYVVNRSLDTAEVVMLADAVNASKLSASQKKTLIERLSGILCSYQAESISKHIIALEKGRKGNSSFIYNVDAIDRAINENKQVSFQYFDYDEKHQKDYRKGGSRYVVNPAVMVWDKDNYYLLGFSNGHRDIVTYRLDKMDKVEVEQTERVIENTSEDVQEKVDWNKMWGKRYPVLMTYKSKVDVKNYSVPLKDLIDDIKEKYGYCDRDAFLVLKDILAQLWFGRKNKK